jgi:hypothetical protein
MTPKQRVAKRYPLSYASWTGYDWMIYRQAPRVISRDSFVSTIGMGATAQKAWADAWRRMQNKAK